MADPERLNRYVCRGPTFFDRRERQTLSTLEVEDRLNKLDRIETLLEIARKRGFLTDD